MKRKRLYMIALLLCLGLLLCACTDVLFTTAEYRSYHSFCERHKAGTEKQAVYEKLGCPDGYFDRTGAYHHISYAEWEHATEFLFAEDAVTWVYECWKYRDPADPYRLRISFDAAGKSMETKMVAVPGG